MRPKKDKNVGVAKRWRLHLRNAILDKMPLSDASRIIGMNPGYMHQFIEKGIPRHLPVKSAMLISEAIDPGNTDLFIKRYCSKEDYETFSGHGGHHAGINGPEDLISAITVDAILGDEIITFHDAMVFLGEPSGPTRADEAPPPMIVLLLSDTVRQEIQGQALQIVPPNSLLLVDPGRTPRPGDLVLAAKRDDAPLVLQPLAADAAYRIALTGIIFPRRGLRM